METKQAKLYTDGGSRGNPGPAGAGGVLILDKKKTFKKYLGEMTNNQAEYSAMIEGMKLAAEEGVTELEVFLDSELIVKQMRGQYKVKNHGLKPLFAEALKLTNNFSNITFQHVYREKNQLADKLVNEAIDEAM
ncbi:ribonuclease HI family protein [Patescibacteria group bacterium]